METRVTAIDESDAMKRSLLTLTLLGLSGTALADANFNGRLTGLSGAGYVTGGYVDGVLYNPSQAAAFGDKDDGALVINLGALGDDEDDLIDGVEELSDYLDELEVRTSDTDQFIEDEFQNVDPNDPNQVQARANELLQEEADEAIARLEAVGDKTVNIDGGASIVLAIPNDLLSVSLVGQTRLEAALTTVLDDSDFEYIESAVGEVNFDAANLNSQAIGRGALVSEVGLAMARRLPLGKDKSLLIGAKPKWVNVTTFIYSSTVEEFDSDDFDQDDYTVEDDDFNVDIGATYEMGRLRYGLAVSNLMKKEYETIEPGDTLVIEPQATAAIGYESGWLTAELAADLTSSAHFATGEDSRFVRAGTELNAYDWLQFRLGYKTDLEDTRVDTFSAGIGLSPFGVVNLDIAGYTGTDSESDTAGASVQLGLRF